MNETQTEEQAVAWLIEQAPQAVHILPISRIKPRANGQVTAHIMVGEFTTKESRHVRPDSLYTSREAAATAALAMLADKREQINRILDRSEAVLRKMLEELA